jgi:hypothetical protein
MIRQAFGKESFGCTLKVKIHRDRKMVIEGKRKVKSMSIFLDIKGIVHK